MPEPWTPPWFKDFLRREANAAPAQNENSIS